MSAYCWMYSASLDDITEQEQDSCAEHGCFCESCPYLGEETDIPLYPEE